jgi:hypothetical protein
MLGVILAKFLFPLFQGIPQRHILFCSKPDKSLKAQNVRHRPRLCEKSAALKTGGILFPSPDKGGGIESEAPNLYFKIVN